MASPTPLVGSISCLTSKKNHEEAMKILRRIATMVHPILKSRTWRVNSLEEFFPAQKNLLGMNTNRGAKIQIRLRPPHAPDTFYPFDDLIGTMLHEMTHIVHGPHNVSFYNLLKELNVEYDKLLDSGYKGQGFDAPGQRLGNANGALRSNRSLHDDRVAALQAAEKRRRLNEMMLPAGGVRLGGEAAGKGDGTTNIGRKKDPDEINWEQWHRPGELAVMAAERRLRDKVWCGTEDESRQAEAAASETSSGKATSNPLVSSSSVSKAANPKLQSSSTSRSMPLHTMTTPNGMNSDTKRGATTSAIPSNKRKASDGVIDLTRDDNTSTPNATSNLPISSIPTLTLSPSSPLLPDEAEWTCPQCTLMNRPLALQCDCCLAIRPLNR